MFVRRRSGGEWKPLPGPLNGAGLMELSWRDPVANIQIEKRQLALVPGDAGIIGVDEGCVSGRDPPCRGCPDGPPPSGKPLARSMWRTSPFYRSGSPDAPSIGFR